MQPILHSRSSANGYPHRRVEREEGMSKPQPMRSHFVKTPDTAVSEEDASLENHSRDRLVYLTACKIGHPVEVQLKNGSLYSGIFHAADVENDYGIILQMACLIKDSTSQAPDFFSKPPSKTLIIPANEIVQVVAKDLPIVREGVSNTLQCEKPQELLTDSSISQSSRIDVGRELKPWVPDEEFPECPELDNIFDVHWNRGWNQFEVNETLFGVKSTFNEELYTTRLERGSKTREMEEQASRIAREIEGESTRDIHIAEERGLQLNEKFDTDEEAKYSSVHRIEGIDDSGYEDEEDMLLDSRNDLTFGNSSASDDNKMPSSGGKGYEDTWSGGLTSWGNISTDQSCSSSDEHTYIPPSDIRSEKRWSKQRKSGGLEVTANNRPSEESVSGLGDSKVSQNGSEDMEKGGKGGGADVASLPPRAAEKQSSSYGGRQAAHASGKPKSEGSCSGRPSSSSASAVSERASGPTGSTRPGLSPTSSFGSLSSEKSTLNPNAKEFKLNPNAKSFKPSQSAGRAPSAVAEGSSFYYPAVPQLPGGYGMGQTYVGQQQGMMYQPQAYYPQSGPQALPQYPQQMMMGQGRPMVYMPPPPPPPFHPDPQYKRRDY